MYISLRVPLFLGKKSVCYQEINRGFDIFMPTKTSCPQSTTKQNIVYFPIHNYVSKLYICISFWFAWVHCEFTGNIRVSPGEINLMPLLDFLI